MQRKEKEKEEKKEKVKEKEQKRRENIEKRISARQKKTIQLPGKRTLEKKKLILALYSYFF